MKLVKITKKATRKVKSAAAHTKEEIDDFIGLCFIVGAGYCLLCGCKDD